MTREAMGTDVVVVGAGPAGLAAAIVADREGEALDGYEAAVREGAIAPRPRPRAPLVAVRPLGLARPRRARHVDARPRQIDRLRHAQARRDRCRRPDARPRAIRPSGGLPLSSVERRGKLAVARCGVLPGTLPTPAVELAPRKPHVTPSLCRSTASFGSTHQRPVSALGVAIPRAGRSPQDCAPPAGLQRRDRALEPRAGSTPPAQSGIDCPASQGSGCECYFADRARGGRMPSGGARDRLGY